MRLLRTATQTIDVRKGDFKLKPRAGVRYDGLYKVTAYSIKKEKGVAGPWGFEFLLERLGNQPVLDRALRAPTEEQIRASSLDEHEEDEPGYDVDDMVVRIIESRRASLVSSGTRSGIGLGTGTASVGPTEGLSESIKEENLNSQFGREDMNTRDASLFARPRANRQQTSSPYGPVSPFS